MLRHVHVLPCQKHLPGDLCAVGESSAELSDKVRPLSATQIITGLHTEKVCVVLKGSICLYNKRNCDK